MIVSGVNSKEKPLIIKKRGVSAYGKVYYIALTVLVTYYLLVMLHVTVLMLSTYMTMIFT